MVDNKIPKIHVMHSRIEINNYDIGDAPRLEYIFSVWNPIYHVNFPKCIEYDKAKRKLILPRGMDIEQLKETFLYEPVVNRNPDPYVDSDPIPIKYLTKDDRQMEILKFILGEEKYSYTKSKSQLSINSTTGSGKTFITVAAICFTGARAIIITSSTNWLQQWKDRILEYTSLKDKDIYMIIGKSQIDKLFARDNALSYQIFLASHSTIKSYGDKNGWDKVEDLFKYLQVSLKVFDEAHLYIDNMAKIDFHSNTKKTLYLTATPARSDKEENIIYQEYFRTVPSIDLFDERTDPHVNYISILYPTHPSPYDVKNYSRGQFNFDRNVYTSYLVGRPNFLKLVSILIDMTLPLNGKVLIYIGTNDAIIKVYKYIISEFEFLQNHVGIYTSIASPEEKEIALTKKYILSTTKSCGAASDIRDLVCTIVLAEPFKSSVLARQTLGRCRADNTLYIDCTDVSCYRTKIYNKQKKNIFLQYAKSCKEILMNDEELDSRVKSIREKYNTKKVMCMRVWKE
jgi:hypothetical protein